MKPRLQVGLIVLCALFLGGGILGLSLTAEPSRPLLLISLLGFAGTATLLFLRAVTTIVQAFPHASKVENIIAPEPPRSLWPVALLGAVIVAVFFLSVHQPHPMDWDELDTASRLARPEVCSVEPNHPYKNLDLWNPFTNTRNHALANWGTFLAFKTWGISEAVGRYVSTFFLAAFCLLLFLFLPRRLSYFMAALLCTHLLGNGLFQWYAQSIRGYISMIFFTTALIAFVTAEQPPRRPLFSLILFFVTAVLSVFTHSFAALFLLLLSFSYLLWVALHAEHFSQSALVFHARRLMLLAIIAPLPIVLLLSQYYFLKRIGYVHTAAITAHWSTVREVLGMVAPWAAWPMAAVVLIGLLLSLKQIENQSFLSVFLFTSFVSLLTLVMALRSTLFESRFLLAFLIPFLLWAYQQCLTLRSLWARHATALGLAAILLVVPAKNFSEIMAARSGALSDFHTFMADIRQWTDTIDPRCLSFSGEHDQVQFARALFYPKSEENTLGCRLRNHVHFGRDWRGEIAVPEWVLHQFRTVYTDDQGRTLFRNRNTVNPLAANIR